MFDKNIKVLTQYRVWPSMTLGGVSWLQDC